MSESMEDISERLSRVVKLALDTGEAASEAEAVAIFSSYRVQLVFGDGLNEMAQVALLTAAATAVPCLLGGITYVGADQALRARWRGHPDAPAPSRLTAALELLGVRRARDIDSNVPCIAVGARIPGDRVGVRATFDGWTAAVVPLQDAALDEEGDCVAAAVLAGAMAVAEIFQFYRATQPLACQRRVGWSLWEPWTPWFEAGRGPNLTALPQSAWLVGLGNLGQAYLWTLGLLPYAKNECQLVLQDFDVVSRANRSTSLLSREIDVGRRKTRLAAAWAEQRGFQTSIVERRFSPDFTVTGNEPLVALIGVDNPATRRTIERVGFGRIIEAGLGRGPNDYLGITLHTFPASRVADACWQEPTNPPADAAHATARKQAYRDLHTASGDGCGVLRLAGRSIATPFTGAAAGALVVGELLRLCHGGRRVEYASVHLARPDESTIILGAPWPVMNPGIVAPEQCSEA